MTRPSKAQAEMLASLFGSYRATFSTAIGWETGKWIMPTERRLILNGWVERTGETGTFPSGDQYETWRINDAGLDALADYLVHRKRGS